MEFERKPKLPYSKQKSSCHKFKYSIIYTLTLTLLLIVLHIIHSSPSNLLFSTSVFFPIPNQAANCHHECGEHVEAASTISRLRDSTTFLPLKDLRYAEPKAAMSGHTWFMSSLNDTIEEDEAEFLSFPSKESKQRLLCIQGRDEHDGSRNSYALAWPDGLPESAILLKGLTFVSDTYYDYENLWHGLNAVAPFIGWSIKNKCAKPSRWVLFHWGELRQRMGGWIEQLMKANYGELVIEGFGKGSEGEEGTSYCFEKAVVMRHNLGRLGKEKKRIICDLLRCKAREFCGIKGRKKLVNGKGEPIIRMTLLMRRGSRSFKNETVVTNVFAKQCHKVKGCKLKVVQSEDLSFCDQVKVMTEADIVASPHGAQLTNMLFMDRGSSVMEFFPRGWLELAGVGQYAHRWMADLSGMEHRGTWWEPLGTDDCPKGQDCFLFYKNGKVGHNETYFAEWASRVLNQVRERKLQEVANNNRAEANGCMC